MNDYGIFFDESNKLDQPKGEYSYYGALGSSLSTINKIEVEVGEIYEKLNTKNEMHFVDYSNDTNFEKYFKVLNYVLQQDIKINLMIVNKNDASNIAEKMSVGLTELRELFYVKIPERLFYGMTRFLENRQNIHIVIDENSEYEKLELETKLEEQMNAHSAYRNKGYKVKSVKQIPSDENVFIQLIDVFMGIVVFLLERQYENSESEERNITKMVKSDLVYRLLINNNNLNKFFEKIVLYKWEGDEEQIDVVHLSEYLGHFLLYKTQFDIKEMNRLAKLRLAWPNMTTRFYREEMCYKNRQLKTIQGYIDELDGKGRNSYYIINN